MDVEDFPVFCGVSGSPGRGSGTDILIRIGIAWLEVGVRERLPGGMGQLSVGTMGSDNEFGVSFSTWGSP